MERGTTCCIVHGVCTHLLMSCALVWNRNSLMCQIQFVRQHCWIVCVVSLVTVFCLNTGTCFQIVHELMCRAMYVLILWLATCINLQSTQCAELPHRLLQFCREVADGMKYLSNARWMQPPLCWISCLFFPHCYVPGSTHVQYYVIAIL